MVSAEMPTEEGPMTTVPPGADPATVVNLDGCWGEELRENIERYDAACPGRFVTFAHLDWSLLADPGGVAGLDRLLASVADSAAAGARGVKVWKDLGLSVRDEHGELVLPDAPQVAAVLESAGQHGLAVLTHTAEPVAFFDPLDRHNERLEELTQSPDWWFGRAGLPSFARLLLALETAVASHPTTTFIGAHVGCYAEDLPTYFRFIETEDEGFGYAPSEEVAPMGRWDISGAGLPGPLLRSFYAGNAARLLGL
jgi:hypothetical protein